jgi:predicted RNase H-like HicB family nuclease
MGSPRVFCGRFVLIGAMNPCSQGYYGDPIQECTCSNAMVTRYQADTRHPADSFAFAQDRLRAAAGPDRPGEAHIEVPRVEATLRVGEKLSDDRLGEPSPCLGHRTDAVRARVEAARFEGTRMVANADAPGKAGFRPGEVRDLCRLDDAGKSLLKAAMQQLHMSARAYHGKTLCVFLSNSARVARILKLARTMADPSMPQGRPGGERGDPDGASFGPAQDRPGGGDSISAQETAVARLISFQQPIAPEREQSPAKQYQPRRQTRNGLIPRQICDIILLGDRNPQGPGKVGIRMERITLAAVLRKEEDLYVAECPEVGTVSQGYTIDEAMSNLKEATELYLEEFPLPSTGKPLLTTFEIAVGGAVHA